MKSRKWTDSELIEAVANSSSVRQVLLKLGLRESGGSHKLVKTRIEELELNTEHFTGSNWGGFRHINPNPPVVWDTVLIQGDKKLSSSLRRKLISTGILKNVCVTCGLGPHWNNQPLTLQVDHENGDPTDNRIENLRVPCPNCHSQTPTWCRRK